MSDWRDNRVVEIQCARSSGYGSGLLLGKGIVLTARHVLLPRGAVLPPTLDILVRTVPMARAGQVTGATLLWPEPSALGVRDPDIALLRVADNAPVMRRPPAFIVDAFDQEEIGAPPMVDVSATGFPSHARIVGADGVPTNQRDTAQISGRVQLGAGLRTGTANIAQLVLGTQHAPTATQRKQWSGISGAALVGEPYPHAERSTQHLLGVVTIHDPDAEHDFEAVRIDRALDDPLARRLLQEAFGMAAVDGAPASEPPGLHKLVWLLDRVPQEEEFVAAYREAAPRAATGAGGARPRKARPLVVLLPGAGVAGHAYPEMLRRLTLRTLPERLKWPPGSGVSKSVYWPARTGLSAKATAARLRQSLWEEGLSQEGDAPARAADFRKLLAASALPRLFHSDLTGRALDGVLADELAEWSEFLAGLVPEDRIAPVHVLMVSAGQDGSSEWLRGATRSGGVNAVVLPELNACRLEPDLSQWLIEALPRHVASVHRPLLARIEARLRREYPERFLVGELRTRLMELESGGLDA